MTEIKHKKALGQNFLTDTNLLKAIVADAGVTSSDIVVEIGAGAGALTMQLAKKAARVLAFEIDSDLIPLLNDNFKNHGNVEIYRQDALKTSYDELVAMTGNKFKVVANLPYYITTPLIFYFLESGMDIDSLTIMVQKEVAQRIVAKPKTSEYGALSMAVGSMCDAQLTRHVSAKMFTPPPKVDSAVIRLTVVRPFDKSLSRLIKCIFAMRRKTVLNNLCAGYSLSKERAGEILNSAGIKLTARAEELGLFEVRAIKEKLISIS